MESPTAGQNELLAAFAICLGHCIWTVVAWGVSHDAE